MLLSENIRVVLSQSLFTATSNLLYPDDSFTAVIPKPETCVWLISECDSNKSKDKQRSYVGYRYVYPDRLVCWPKVIS